MNRAAAKIASKLRNFQQKQHCMEIGQEMLTNFNDDPNLLKKVITDDKSRGYGNDIESKAQSSGFATIEEIKEKLKHELLAIAKSTFQKCFEDWIKRWHKYITYKGGYFEGDKIFIDKKNGKKTVTFCSHLVYY